MFQESDSLELIDSTEDFDSMKVDGTNEQFLPVSISFMVIVSQNCLCIRRFLIYGNQPHYEMDFLLDSTSENDFTSY